MEEGIKRTYNFDSPGVYRIRVEGHLDEEMSDLLGGMVITRAFTLEKNPITILVGQLRDQAALAGVLNDLYEMHLTLITVESLSPEINFCHFCQE